MRTFFSYTRINSYKTGALIMKLEKWEWIKNISRKQMVLMCVLLVGVYFLASPPTRLSDGRQQQDATNLVGSMGETYSDDAEVQASYTVYLLHDSGYLVKTEFFANQGADRSSVQSVFSALQVGTQHLQPSVTGLIPNGAVIRDYELNDDTLTLNLSESFLYYRTSIEQNLLTSLVWSLTELDQINRVQFEIEGETVNNFNTALDVSRGLTRAMGINIEVAAPRVVDAQMMLLYFFTDDSDELLVPVTRLVAPAVEPFEYAVASLVRGARGANYVSVFNHRATLLEQPKLENGIMTLNFCAELFFDLEQTQVSSLAIKQLVMTMTEFAEVYEVSVVVEGSSRVFDDAGNPITVPVSRNVVRGNQSRLRGFVHEY